MRKQGRSDSGAKSSSISEIEAEAQEKTFLDWGEYVETDIEPDDGIENTLDFTDYFSNLRKYFSKNPDLDPKEALKGRQPIAIVVNGHNIEVQLKRCLKHLLSLKRDGVIPEYFDIQENFCIVLGDDSIKKMDEAWHGKDLEGMSAEEKGELEALFDGIMRQQYPKPQSQERNEEDEEKGKSKEEIERRYRHFRTQAILKSWFKDQKPNSVHVSLIAPPLTLGYFCQENGNLVTDKVNYDDALLYAAFNIRKLYELALEPEFLKKKGKIIEDYKRFAKTVKKLEDEVGEALNKDVSTADTSELEEANKSLAEARLAIDACADEELSILSKNETILRTFKMLNLLSGEGYPFGVCGNYPVFAGPGFGRDISPDSCPHYVEYIDSGRPLTATARTIIETTEAWNAGMIESIRGKIAKIKLEDDAPEAVKTAQAEIAALFEEYDRRLREKNPDGSKDRELVVALGEKLAPHIKILERYEPFLEDPTQAPRFLRVYEGKPSAYWTVSKHPGIQAVLADPILHMVRRGIGRGITLTSSQEPGFMCLDEEGNLNLLMRLDEEGNLNLLDANQGVYTQALLKRLKENKALREALTFFGRVYDRFECVDGLPIRYDAKGKVHPEDRKRVLSAIDHLLCRTILNYDPALQAAEEASVAVEHQLEADVQHVSEEVTNANQSQAAEEEEEIVVELQLEADSAAKKITDTRSQLQAAITQMYVVAANANIAFEEAERGEGTTACKVDFLARAIKIGEEYSLKEKDLGEYYKAVLPCPIVTRRKKGPNTKNPSGRAIFPTNAVDFLKELIKACEQNDKEKLAFIVYKPAGLTWSQLRDKNLSRSPAVGAEIDEDANSSEASFQ